MSFVSKTLSRMLLPNLEKDLSKAVTESLKSSAQMTDCFLSPAVYAFEKTPVSSGFGHATSSLERRVGTSFEKVHYPAPAKGLFQ
jgi:hypothetical protein